MTSSGDVIYDITIGILKISEIKISWFCVFWSVIDLFLFCISSIMISSDNVKMIFQLVPAACLPDVYDLQEILGRHAEGTNQS